MKVIKIMQLKQNCKTEFKRDFAISKSHFKSDSKVIQKRLNANKRKISHP